MAKIPLLEGRTRLPVICSPMFLVSFPALVMAQCKAGLVGSFPALNARPESELEKWIVGIREELRAFQLANPNAVVAPFPVNQILSSVNERVGVSLQDDKLSPQSPCRDWFSRNLCSVP